MRFIKLMTLVFAVFAMVSGKADAATPLLDLSQIIKLGDTESATIEKLKRTGIRMEIVPIDLSHGYSKALTAGPGLLALLNRHDVQHDLLNPAKRPSFVLLNQHSRMGVVAFTDGKVHSFLLALSDADVKPSTNPFEYGRLKTFHKKLTYLKSLCKRIKPSQKLSNGQAYAWSGTDCVSRGRHQIVHQPGLRYPLALLAHP